MSAVVLILADLSKWEEAPVLPAEVLVHEVVLAAAEVVPEVPAHIQSSALEAE